MNPKLTKILNSFEGYTKEALREWRVPGIAVAIVKKDRLIYAKGFGTRQLSGTAPVNTETLFQIGSISKSFTATLISMLVDQGKLNWLDRVRDHLPDFKLMDTTATKEFTVEDLLAQRSGLPPYSARLLPFLGYSRKYIVKNLRLIKPISPFREEYAYQNNLFLIAAALIEKHMGKAWEKALKDHLLAPLGMAHTNASLQGYANSTNAACGHYFSGNGPNSPVEELPMNWPYHDWVYTLGPAGGINSNILDMAKWLKFNLGGGLYKGNTLVSKKNLNRLYSPKIRAPLPNNKEPRYYCLGWLRSEYKPHPFIWHNGGTSGMSSVIALAPETGIGVVILSNLSRTLLPEALIRVLWDLWFDIPKRDWSRIFHDYQLAETEKLKEPPGPKNPPRPTAAYLGTYYNKLYGPLTIAGSRGSLIAVIGPRKIRQPLHSWGGDTFVLYWPGVLTEGVGVQFYANKTNRVDRVEIQGMNDDLTGVFVRQS